MERSNCKNSRHILVILVPLMLSALLKFSRDGSPHYTAVDISPQILSDS